MSQRDGGETEAHPGSAAGLLERREVHDGKVVKLSLDRVRFPDGSTGVLEMIRHPGASAVVPVLGSLEEEDPDVLLLRQYRYAVGGELYEVPAGVRDEPDESWEACARRELEEETGYRAGRLLPLTRIYTTPGFTDEVIHLFLAAELALGTEGRDADEFMELVRLPLSEAVEWVRAGRILDAKSAVALLYARAFVLDGVSSRGRPDVTG